MGTWHPAEAARLQQALRLTNEAFAETLGAAPRTVAKWHANPDISLTLEMQAALDTLLRRATPEAQQRFEQLARSTAADASGDGGDRRDLTERLLQATHLHSSLAWLDDVRQGEPGTSFDAVVRAAAAKTSRASVLAARGPDRPELSKLLLDYYSDGDTIEGAVFLEVSGTRLETSLVTRQAWPSDGLPRVADAEFSFSRAEVPAAPQASPGLIAAAEDRLVRCLTGGTRLVDQPTYRLLSCEPRPDVIRAAFSLTSFTRYALSLDLLEAEALSAVAAGSDRMELRDQLLPGLASVFDPSGRECVGGSLALTALARPAQGDRPADFLLLLQERSGRVVNGTGRIAVIPKCFHQPTNEPPAEVDIRTTLLRELEEELFGRAEVDSTDFGSTVADVLHPSRMTAPLAWLLDAHGLDIRLTGFAYNLVAGSYEFPALIAVHDEAFWRDFGGAVEANWESSGLSRLSSADPDGIEELLQDPRWSDEGLVAFALGLKKLAETNPDRVRLPDFEIGVTH
ncbi:hypothetical protein UB45_10805 [Terrabacter sp. 28]|nr:hypothetical protein UB45_10805 [Terrabacter sp. 28]